MRVCVSAFYVCVYVCVCILRVCIYMRECILPTRALMRGCMSISSATEPVIDEACEVL